MEFILLQLDHGKKIKISLSGFINEDSEVAFQTLAPKIQEADGIIFNFAEVKGINSLGVRAWVQFLRLASEKRQVVYEECVPDVIMQINMIPSFLGKAKIDSFYVHYLCESCSSKEGIVRVLVDADKLPKDEIPPAPQCGTCKELMETEELEEEYFSFLSR